MLVYALDVPRLGCFSIDEKNYLNVDLILILMLSNEISFINQ